MITDLSAILVICTSLRESVLFFLLKEAHFQGLTLQPALVRLDQEGCFPAGESRISEGMILGSQR